MGRALQCSIGFALCLHLGAQPKLAAAVNAASYLTPGLPNAGIAQGSIFVIYGSGLGPAELAQAQRLPLDVEMSGTSVRIDAAGNQYQTPLLYTSDTAVSGIFPSAVPEGQAVITVTYNGNNSAGYSAQVRKAAFGIFTQNQAGLGPAILQTWNAGVITLNGIHAVSLPGQVGILWGTGLGGINGSDADVPPAGDLPAEVEVLVGGQSANVLYHGRSPTYPGLDQINFEVPAGLIGCYVPIAVRADGVMSNFASMTIGTGGTICGDNVSFRGRLFSGLTGATVSIGTVDMTHQEYSSPNGPPIFWSEQASGRFFEVDWNYINFLPNLSGYEVLPGTCNVVWNRWNTPEEMGDIYPALNLPTNPMWPGDYLKVNATASTKQFTQINPGEYEAQLGGMTEPGGVAVPRFMNAGTYTLDNLEPPPPPDAGAAVAVSYDIHASLTIPGEIQWTNKAALSEVDRSQDLTFEWSGGLDASEYVLVGGSSADADLQTRVTFMCAVTPSAGKLTVPSWMVQILPQSSPSQANAAPYGFLFMGSSSNNINSLATTPGAFGMIYFRYLFLYNSIVDFR